MRNFVCGLDIGQRQDYTAFVVIEKVCEVHKISSRTSVGASTTKILNLDVGEAKRFELGTSYTNIVDSVFTAMKDLQFKDGEEKPVLVVDATNNAAIVDLINQKFKEDRRFKVVPVIITAGGQSSEEKNVYKVPKIELIQRTQLALEQGKLRFAEGMKYLDIFTNELENYNVKIVDSGSEFYDARSGEHDDLVLALSLAIWWCMRNGYEYYHRGIEPIVMGHPY